MMAILDWRAKKKLHFFLLALIVVGGAVLFLLYLSWPKATCSDGRQNQQEDGVDCGGPCVPCVVNPKDVVVLWSRVFKTSEGVYDAAALVENPNLFYGLPFFKYTFKIYDSDNVLVAVKEGQTFLNPHDKFLIFANDIKTGQRQAARSFVEIENLSVWKYLGESKSTIVISEKSFSNTPFPFLRARLLNQSPFSIKEIQAAAVLYDENENAVAVSSTKLDFIEAEGSQDAFFTWSYPFAVEPVSNKIFTRVDLTN
ncbi:hypothetical protein KKB69_02265 [Patescibacteria group bacterium]|nr:hypothetical protein [Patescibacteria group bacterium]